jgi:hypothetical protein
VRQERLLVDVKPTALAVIKDGESTSSLIAPVLVV